MGLEGGGSGRPLHLSSSTARAAQLPSSSLSLGTSGTLSGWHSVRIINENSLPVPQSKYCQLRAGKARPTLLFPSL